MAARSRLRTHTAEHATPGTPCPETGATFLHPYDDQSVIAGQGTATLELLEQIPILDVVMAPVGGGGLISGTAIAAHGITASIRVVGAEPAGADDAFRSLQTGTIIPSISPHTIADGLLTTLGQLTLPIIQAHVSQIVTVSEAAIIHAMRLVWERAKLVIEPSAAVPLGALLEKKANFSGLRIGIIISGGNVDLDRLPWIDNQ
jgi:threonine dehydratase